MMQVPNGYGYYLSYGNMYLDFKGITESSVSNYKEHWIFTQLLQA